MKLEKTFKLSLVLASVFVVAQADSQANGDDLPPAKPGQCFTKAFFPAQYATTTERVLASEASEKVEVIPPRYEMVTERIKVSDGTEKIITTQPQFKTVSERVLAKPEEKIWRTSLANNAPEASKTCLDSAKASGMNIDGATPGTCYYEHYLPEKYATTTERVLASEASERVESIPAQYKTVTKRVLSKPASQKLVTIPATYKTVTERILVKPATTEWKRTKCQDRGCNEAEVVCLINIPAVYNTVTKQVVATPAMTKPVPIPEEYKTVQVQELAQPATTRTIPIPATYKTISKQQKVQDGKYFWKDASSANAQTRNTLQCDRVCLTATPAQYNTVTKQVMAKPAGTQTLKTPAVYNTLQVQKLVQPASERRIPIPATYKTITKTQKVKEEYAKWVPIVCQTSVNSTMVTNVQNALKTQGFYKGDVSGTMNESTKNAIREYQKAKGLPVAGLSVATMQSLGLY